MACALLLGLAAAHPASAQNSSYSGPNYSGGATNTTNYGSYNGGRGGETKSPPAASCSGPITASFPWNAGPANDPPPQSVIVTRTCTASGRGNTYGSSHWGLETAASNDGLGDTGTSHVTFVPPQQEEVTGSNCTRTICNSRPGAGVIALTCSPSSSGTSPNGPMSASVTYTASVSPVFITLTGPVKDSSYQDNILVGQHCTSSLGGIPAGCTVSNWQWGVTGTTFQTWQEDTPPVNGNPYIEDASYYVSGPGRSDQPNAIWYYNDLQPQQAEIVTCTATVTPPAGQGSPFTVTAMKTVEVWRPSWTATGTGGYVKINTGPSGFCEIFAGPTASQAAGGQRGGMNFTASVASPNVALFGNGILELVQLAKPFWVFRTIQGTAQGLTCNGQQGLDGGYPYGWVQSTPVYKTDDLPGFVLDDQMTTATFNTDFEDYLMYFAPGSAQCVPVARFIWDTQADVKVPSTGHWTDWSKQHSGSDAAGTVTPTGTLSKFLPYNEFPMWTQINVPKFVSYSGANPVLNLTQRMPIRSDHQVKTAKGKTMKKQFIGVASSVLLGTAGCALVPARSLVVQGMTRRHSVLTPRDIAINEQQGHFENAAATALDAGDYSGAEDDARQSMFHNLGSGKGQEILALALNAQGKTEEAFKVYREIATQGDSNSRNLLPYALLLLRSGQWEQAINTYNKQLPYLSFSNDNIMQANSHFSADVPQPVELETAIHVALGLTYIGSSSWGGRLQNDKAMREFSRAVQLAPDSPVTNYYYGFGWKRLDPKSELRADHAAQAKSALKRAAASDNGDVKNAATEALRGIE